MAMTLSLEAAIQIANNREQEFVVAGWTPTPAEREAMKVIADHAWLWRRFELAHPEVATEFRAGVDVSVELRGKG
jgi:hypothetical protein